MIELRNPKLRRRDRKEIEEELQALSASLDRLSSEEKQKVENFGSGAAIQNAELSLILLLVRPPFDEMKEPRDAP